MKKIKQGKAMESNGAAVLGRKGGKASLIR